MRTLLLVVVLHCCFDAWPQSVEPLDTGSSVVFQVKNFGVQVEGRFTGLSGHIDFDPRDPVRASIDLSVLTTTLETGIDLRNNHLKKEEYFNVKEFPAIHFATTSVESTTVPGRFTATGRLTIKGSAKEIRFPFTAELSDSAYLFKGMFSINRRDFNVGGHSLTMADNVNVVFNIKTTSLPVPATQNHKTP